MRTFPLVVLMSLSALPVRASGYGSGGEGTGGAAFLKLGADARAVGMGNAVRAIVSDATAIYWNPAGLAGLHERHATVTHGASYQSTFLDFIAYAQPIEASFSRSKGRRRDLIIDQLGAIGVGVLYQNSGAIATIDNSGVSTGDRITPQDLAVFIAWGAPLTRSLDVGIGIKYVNSNIQSSAKTGAVDLGARWRAHLPGEFPYTLALSAQNIGGQLKFHEIGDPLPLVFTIAQALKITSGLSVTLDLNAPRDRSIYPCFGMEWRVPIKSGLAAALRVGYERRLDRSALGGGLPAITLGAGLGVQRLSFDYGWSPAGDLGAAHKLSLSSRF